MSDLSVGFHRRPVLTPTQQHHQQTMVRKRKDVSVVDTAICPVESSNEAEWNILQIQWCKSEQQASQTVAIYTG